MKINCRSVELRPLPCSHFDIKPSSLKFEDDKMVTKNIVSITRFSSISKLDWTFEAR